MSENSHIQEAFFKQIKDLLPSHLSLVEEVADLLEISNDSAYRRIRGEKDLSLAEAVKLCTQFKISPASFISNESSTVQFRHVSVEEKKFTLQQYLDSLLEEALLISSVDGAELTYITTDITIFQLFQVPELAAFKLFFWGKTNLGFTGFRDQLFSFDHFDETFYETTRQIADAYIKITTTEIIGEEAINSILRQIRYHLDSGFFKNKEDALFLCDKVVDFVSHFQKQSEVGYKFPYNTEPEGTEGNFALYYNEILVIDGIMFVKLGDSRITYITTNTLNYLQTTDPGFYESNYKWAENLMSKSSLISGVSEKIRNRFFLKLQNQIRQFKDQITD